MHSSVYFRTQLNYPTTVGLFEACFEALSEEAFRLVLLSERRSPLGTGPHALFMMRRFFPSGRCGHQLLLAARGFCLLPVAGPSPGRGVWGCVCVCACIFTPADHSPRGWRARWGAGGGEPPAVSRARSRHFLYPCSSLGMCAAPASSLPGPPLHPRKTRGLCLLVTHGRKLCRQ